MRMYNDDIKVTAYSSETEPWRLLRIERVIGYVQARMDVDGDSNVFDKISELHDHKGTLTVHWKVKPTTLEKNFFKQAWRSQIGDGVDNVTHEVV